MTQRESLHNPYRLSVEQFVSSTTRARSIRVRRAWLPLLPGSSFKGFCLCNSTN